MNQDWEKNNINQVNETYLQSPKISATCPSSPGAQRQFITKLIDMLNDRSNSILISWNQSGDSFIIKDTDTFSQVILPKYFKTNNFNSFVRQLYMYNFHKVKSDTTKITMDENQYCIFENENFIRDKPELLSNIKRKINEKDNDIKSQFYDLQNKYLELYVYVKHLQEDLINVKEENYNLNNMINNLKNYTDRTIKYYLKTINNNIYNVQNTKYQNTITSQPLNDNHITGSQFIVENNHNNMQSVACISPSNHGGNNLSSSININTINPMYSPLTSIIQTQDDEYNYMNSNNLNSINFNANNFNNSNINNNGRYITIGNTEFHCLSPNISDISD